MIEVNVKYFCPIIVYNISNDILIFSKNKATRQQSHSVFNQSVKGQATYV